jgi:hypothetical protein
LYANDVKLCKEINNGKDSIKLQEDMNMEYRYILDDNFGYNVNKCHLFPLTAMKSTRKPVYITNDEKTERVESIKDSSLFFNYVFPCKHFKYNVESKRLRFVMKKAEHLNDAFGINLLFNGTGRRKFESASIICLLHLG